MIDSLVVQKEHAAPHAGAVVFLHGQARDTPSVGELLRWESDAAIKILKKGLNSPDIRKSVADLLQNYARVFKLQL